MYEKKHIYTDKELLQYKINDMKTEIRCAKRDGLNEYAVECENKLAKLEERKL